MRRTAAASLLLLGLAAGPAGAGLFPDNAFSDDARGLAGAQFLKAPPSARFAALAGAGLTLGCPDAFFLNPAGAAGLSGRAVSASYEALLEGSSRTGLVLSNAAASGVFSAGLLYRGSDAGPRLDGAGTAFGSAITAYDAAAGAGWARRFGLTDFGFGVKYVRSALDSERGATAAVDAGFVFRGSGGQATDLALALRNFGPPLKLGSGKAPLPSELAGGLRWRYSPEFNVFAEGRLPSDHAPYLVFAGEWLLPVSAGTGFALRGGLNFRNFGDHGFMGAFAGGFGLRFGGLSLDYAFVPYGELGSTHRMTAGWAWGAPRRAAPRAVPRRRLSGAVAVAPFEAAGGVTAAEAAVVRNLVESELAKTGRFRVVERSRLDFILAEKKLAYAGLSGETAAAELARLSSAKLAVFGAVSRDARGYNVTARLVDAATGEVQLSDSVSVAEDYLFRDAARRLAAALSGD